MPLSEQTKRPIRSLTQCPHCAQQRARQWAEPPDQEIEALPAADCSSTPARIVSDSGTSPSRAVLCCATSWPRQPRLPFVGTSAGAVASCIWPVVAIGASPRWRRPAGWPSASIGCGVRNAIISRLPWCEVNHRPLDWASRSLSREFEVVIMVERAIGEMVGSDRVRPIDYMRTLVNDEGFFNQSATEQLLGVHAVVRAKID